MKIYLSGPMTGLPENNYPAFHAAAATLRAAGHEVVSPAEHPAPLTSTSWEQFMRDDLRAMLGCDCLALLPGWQASRGAHLELHVAHRVGMTITEAAALALQTQTSACEYCGGTGLLSYEAGGETRTEACACRES